MGNVAPFILLFFITACSPSTDSIMEKSSKLSGQDQYELISHISFPRNFKVISNPAFRSGDRVRKAIIELSKNDCTRFYGNYGFLPANDTMSPFGSNFMDSIYRLIPDKSNFLHKYGRNYATNAYYDKYEYNYQCNTKWVYLLDTINCRLYCLISYSDLSGYAR